MHSTMIGFLEIFTANPIMLLFLSQRNFIKFFPHFTPWINGQRDKWTEIRIPSLTTLMKLEFCFTRGPFVVLLHRFFHRFGCNFIEFCLYQACMYDLNWLASVLEVNCVFLWLCTTWVEFRVIPPWTLQCQVLPDW